MTLKEKLQEENVYINAYSFKLTKESVEKFEKIAEEFAIGFAEWCDENYNTLKPYDMKQLLEMYKKEKGL
jgi:hypothetical protein